MATLWGWQWTREELLARVGRLEQVAGIRLVEGPVRPAAGRTPEEVPDDRR